MCKCNWDEVLAYPTVKIVKVKDRYLGGIRYLMLLAIFAYIVGYIVLYNGGYNLCIVPNGSIELSLKKPDGIIYPANYSYCTQYNETHQKYNISDPLQCVVVDESDVYQPVDQTNAMFISTRFSQILQQRNPDCEIGCDEPWIDVSPNMTNYTGIPYYSAGVDNFTLRLGHFFQARQFYLDTRNNYYSQSCAEMSGKLENVNGDTIAHYGNDAADIIPLSLILDAANVELNDISDNPTDAENHESFRHAGCVLFFGIDYNGVYKSPVKYTYTVTQVPKVEYKVTRTTTVSSGQRLVSDTHGVKIFFVFSGEICEFDFQTLLIQLVSGLGLLGMATLLTDLAMIYVMPLRGAYQKYKFKETAVHDVLAKHMSRKDLELSKSENDIDDDFVVNSNDKSINNQNAKLTYRQFDE